MVSEHDLHIFGLTDFYGKIIIAALVLSCRIQSMVILTFQSFQK